TPAVRYDPLGNAGETPAVRYDPLGNAGETPAVCYDPLGEDEFPFQARVTRTSRYLGLTHPAIG
ncbi:MAG: hypothetical protein ACLFU6_05695, partial [Candidatus Hydrogenedentota bacterium]